MSLVNFLNFLFSKKRKVDNTEISSSSPKRRCHLNYCLPSDVIFIILLCLPADVLYNIMRLVCREWYNLIQSPTFISSHLQNSTNNGLLIQYKGINGYVIRPWSHGHALEVKDVDYRFVRKVGASCNGLLFVVGPVTRKTSCPSYIVNPVTKQYLPLPLFPETLTKYFCYFAYAATSRVYKVMCYTYNKSRCLLILTVGVDKAWREVDISLLAPDVIEAICTSYGKPTLTLRGFVYWLCKSVPIIVRFDMETETFAEIPVSSQCFNTNTNCCYGLLPMENSVCLWRWKLDNKNFYEFWLLKDLETGHGQCEKLLDLNIENLHLRRSIYNHSIMPLGWLRSRELLVLGLAAETMVYNVNTGQIHQTGMMKIARNDCGFDYHLHVDSLVPLNNLSLVMTPQLPYKSPRKVYLNDNMRAEFER